MPKIIIVQHSPYEPLGIIIDTLRQDRMRLRYINYHRHPEKKITLEGYDGLIVLGGQMNPDQLKLYPHLTEEIELIQQAITKSIPVLGICLGSQLLNLALGGTCYALPKPKFGWIDVTKRQAHPMFNAFSTQTRAFHWHQFASKVPSGVDVILENEDSIQGFCAQDIFIGLQFHLEIDLPLISRWLEHPDYLTHLQAHLAESDIEKIRQDTQLSLPNSVKVGHDFFQTFSKLFNKKKSSFSSMHADK